MNMDLRLISLFFALVIGSMLLGGGVYETLLVDSVWPNNPALIQPARGGINRGRFWARVHPPYEVALLVSLWLNWGAHAARPWLIVVLIVHVAARTWSFVYFIPRALRFEKIGDFNAEELKRAKRWVGLSRVRPILEFVSITALCVAFLVEVGPMR
jgi:hypothetical protein